MQETAVITSRQNPRVQQLVRLRERAGRVESGLFLVEGCRELSRALAAEMRVTEIYFCPVLFKNREAAAALLRRAGECGVGLFELGESAFEKVSGREGADGFLGVARLPGLTLDLLVPRLEAVENPLILVVEAVEKPGNLGALFRTADSVGCAALICCDPVADPFNPNVIRASQGALFPMPCAVAGPEAVAEFLRVMGVRIFAAAPDAKRCYWDSDFRGSSAILLGSEKDGLSQFWLQNTGKTCDLGLELISIPQLGLSDSLNVGIAGAVCLFEALRQRTTGNL
jgi:TrmH family RNA methyltransferase